MASFTLRINLDGSPREMPEIILRIHPQLASLRLNITQHLSFNCKLTLLSKIPNAPILDQIPLSILSNLKAGLRFRILILL